MSMLFEMLHEIHQTSPYFGHRRTNCRKNISIARPADLYFYWSL